jgi:hypothetical protein
MQVLDAAGRPLNATFSAEPEGDWVALIMESRSGRAAGRPGRNADYNPALTLLLERLCRLDATLVDALVDSRKTQALGIPEVERRLITEPVRLALVPDMEALRVRMGTAQAKIAQEPDATKGGNSTKRIRLRLDVPGYGPDQAQRVAGILSVPLQEAGAPRVLLDRVELADNERPTEDDFAAAVAALDALDKAGHRALRVEQAYLRKALFKGSAALCDLCGRVFEVEFLVAAHIKKRADCDDQEKRDVAHVVMSACRFGCDELYERGYIAVGDDGQFILSHAIEASEHARAYAVQHLKGKFFGRPMTGRANYFTWHRENKFLDAVLLAATVFAHESAAFGVHVLAGAGVDLRLSCRVGSGCAEEAGERGDGFEQQGVEAGLLVGGAAGAELGDGAAVPGLGGELADPGGHGGVGEGGRAARGGAASRG